MIERLGIESILANEKWILSTNEFSLVDKGFRRCNHK
jgi:hypothetical protein